MRHSIRDVSDSLQKVVRFRALERTASKPLVYLAFPWMHRHSAWFQYGSRHCPLPLFRSWRLNLFRWEPPTASLTSDPTLTGLASTNAEHSQTSCGRGCGSDAFLQRRVKSSRGKGSGSCSSRPAVGADGMCWWLKGRGIPAIWSHVLVPSGNIMQWPCLVAH